MAQAKSTSGSSKGQPTFIPRRKKVKAGTPMTNPPLTPLIDVFLFLIIFFLLGCKFAQYEGTIPANLPKTGSGLGESSEIALPPIRILLQPADDKGDTITIATDGAIGKHSVSDMQELCTILAEWGKKHDVVGENVPKGRKQPIFIHPVLKVRWGFVVDAFNQAVRAGYTEVGVAPSRNPLPGAQQS